MARPSKTPLGSQAADKLAKQNQLIEHGWRLQQAGELAMAEEVYASVLKANPKHFNAAYLLGNMAAQAARHQTAVNFYTQAIRINPSHAEPYNNRGNALLALKQFGAAVASFDTAISIQANYAEAYSNRGNALFALKKFGAAVASLDKAVSLKSDYAEAYSNRGNALSALKQLDAAVASFDAAIRLKPDYAQAFSNRGIALLELKQQDAALASFDAAIRIRHDYAEAYSNRGNALRAFHQWDAAMACYDQAIQLDPDLALAYMNKSITLLLQGNFADGWPLHEWRNGNAQARASLRHFKQPLWLGTEPLLGKTILLHCEQGLGDTIQFARYARLVKQLGARVVMEVPATLITLLTGLAGVDELIAEDTRLPGFDYHCPLLSLPLAFNTHLATIPSPQPYLQSRADKVATWQARLGEKVRPRVGLVWCGNPLHKNDHNRSFTVNLLLPYLAPDVDYICLQKELRDIDRAPLQHSPIRFLGNDIKDFTDTAALCELVDLVISVDTSVAHLAGALGKATWLMLPYVPDWRWLLNRNDSPWYASMCLYRQDAQRDWATVLKQVAQDMVPWRLGAVPTS
ncbi:MAG: tetratricopeptide repeat protein [Comamonadaceae bacterium]|nr:tetratricopeptide repeat protein [Comamonadaceae bacterium]